MSKDVCHFNAWGVKLAHKVRDAVHARNRKSLKRSDGELEEIWRFWGLGFEVLGQDVCAWCWVHVSMFGVRCSVDEGLCVDLFACADGDCSSEGFKGACARDPGAGAAAGCEVAGFEEAHHALWKESYEARGGD